MNEYFEAEDFDFEEEIPVTEPVKNPQPQYSPTYVPPKKKGWTAGKIVALAICCGLIGGIAGFAGAFLGGVLQQDSYRPNDSSMILVGNREDATLDTIPVDTDKRMTAAQVYASNVNSTVGITTSILTNYWGFPTTSAASGSGFVITADGYILTNYHVVEDSDSITVSMYDGTTYDAKLIGYDAGNDLAVLKVDAENLVPVILGDSDSLQVGDDVVAIGNPLGELTFSLTSGAVSALNREVTFSGNITMDLIQTDCAINSGNSGGALFNLYGEVVGITNAKYSSSGSEASIDNIGFAIPINDVKNAVKGIIENGYIVKPYIGVSVSDVGEEAQGYGLPKGAAVESVMEGAPAAAAGLQKNDIITSVNGKEITGSSGLMDVVAASKVGDVMVLAVYRQGKTVEISVTVGEQTQDTTPQQQPQQSQTPQQMPQQETPEWGDIWDMFPFGDFFG